MQNTVRKRLGLPSMVRSIGSRIQAVRFWFFDQ